MFSAKIFNQPMTQAKRKCAVDPSRECAEDKLVPPCVEQIVDIAIGAGNDAQQMIRSSRKVTGRLKEALKLCLDRGVLPEH